MPVRSFQWVRSLLAGAAIAFVLYCAWALFYYGSHTRDFGWTFARKPDGTFVTYVDPKGPAAGALKAGDRLLAIANSPAVAALDPNLAVRAITATGAYQVRISRQPAELDIPLRLTTRKDWQLTYRQSPFLFGAFVSLLIALVLLRRPADPAARLFFALLLCFSVRQALLVVHPFYNLFSTAEQWFVLAAWAPEPFYLLIALEFHSMYRFPASAPKSLWWSGLQAAFYLIYTGFLLRTLIHGRAELPIPGALIHFYPGRAVYGPPEPGIRDTITLVYGLAALLAICAVVVRNYRLIDDIVQRRRMRWIMCGFVAGLSPYCLILLVQFIGRTAGIEVLQRGPHWAGILWALNGWLTIIPLCFGYAVARHRVFDISLIVRRGLQYLLARRMLQLLLLMPAIALVLSILSNPSRTMHQLLFEDSGMINVALVAATAASLRYHQKLRTWLDRRFFRQAYNSEAILMTLPERLRDLHTPSEVAAKVAADVSAALHPRAVHVLAANPSSAGLSMIFSSDGSDFSLEYPEQSRRTSSCSISEMRSSAETELLQQRGIRLAVPLRSDSGLAGLLLLAERKSEEPYSSRDRALLEAIAAQAAILLEKFRLEEELDRQRQELKQMKFRLGDEIANLCRECPACGTCYDFTATVCVHDGRVPAVVRPVDRTIQARYRLDRLIGRGGMGAVYQATDIRLKREVAIKIMLNDLFGNDKALRRFQREAEVSARLEHPNIVRIYDFGAVHSGAFLVMEYLKGITGRKAMEAGTITPDVVARRVDALLAGIEAAHAAGVIHRDLKPENLLIVPDGHGGEHLKILDFGLAKVKLLHIGEAEQLTVAGVTIGTLGYMSPEQIAGGEIDQRTDVYAIGTIALEMLTGRITAEDSEVEDMLGETLQGDLPQLANVLRTARKKQREYRYASAAELRKALGTALASVEPREFTFDRAMVLKRLGITASVRP